MKPGSDVVAQGAASCLEGLDRQGYEYDKEGLPLVDAMLFTHRCLPTTTSTVCTIVPSPSSPCPLPPSGIFVGELCRAHHVWFGRLTMHGSAGSPCMVRPPSPFGDLRRGSLSSSPCMVRQAHHAWFDRLTMHGSTSSPSVLSGQAGCILRQAPLASAPLGIPPFSVPRSSLLLGLGYIGEP